MHVSWCEENGGGGGGGTVVHQTSLGADLPPPPNTPLKYPRIAKKYPYIEDQFLEPSNTQKLPLKTPLGPALFAITWILGPALVFSPHSED